MPPDTFKALVVDQRDGATVAEIREVGRDALPPDDVLVEVAYSSLNYKDGLAVTGAGKVLRSFPMAAGIDLAGTVLESGSPEYRPGDQVVLTGWGLGERHWGGYSQLNRVPAEWLVPLPEGLSMRQAMGIGTAGFTAMLAVLALEEAGVAPGGREVLVTGAAGGVGSVAVALLARRGYDVAAATGRPEAHDYLRELGARRIVERSALTAPGRPLESETWAGAVDTVGGDTLAGVLRATAYYGAVAACGNAGGITLTTTVFPFILRGVRLIGVNSASTPMDLRTRIWARLASDLKPRHLSDIAFTITLEQLPEQFDRLLKGVGRGRAVVKIT